MQTSSDSNGSASSDPSAGTSRSLLGRIKTGDTAAWDQLVQLYAPLIVVWCGRWGLHHQDVADVLQEVFLAVTQHIGSFRKEQPGDTFRGWLYRITRNKVLDLFRRQGREPCGVGGSEAQLQWGAVPAPEESTADEAVERGLFLRGLDAIRAEFEPRTWQAFWKTTVEGRATGDVAADLSMSPGAVRVAKSRVLQRLREELGDLME